MIAAVVLEIIPFLQIKGEAECSGRELRLSLPESEA